MRGRDEKFVKNLVGEVSGKSRVERIFFLLKWLLQGLKIWIGF